MPTIHDLDLPFLDVFSDEFAADRHGTYARIRECSPLAMTPMGVAVLGHAQVHALLRDQRLRQHALQNVLEMQGESVGPFAERELGTLIALDGADHLRLRKLVAPAFTPSAVNRLRPLMRVLVGERADAVGAAGRCEFVEDVARPYPIPVICALAGAPREDWDAIGSWAEDVLRVFNFDLANDRDAITAAHEAFDRYVGALAEHRRHQPGDDLLSALLAVEEDGDRLSTDELVRLVEAILVGGSDTTRNQLALAAWTFAQHPEQWELLAEQPDLARAAVDESVRWSAPTATVVRRANEDVDLAGVTIPAGSTVVLVTEAANRDPAVHPDPDRFDITRTAEAPVLSFGSGPHYCLGASLARAELEEALTVLSRRWTDLRLDGPVSWRPLPGIQGPTELPVAFAVRSNAVIPER
jgi:cytochrome P450